MSLWGIRVKTYLNQKKKYKKLLYFIKTSVAEKNMRRIGELASKSPNIFWRNIKHLMKNTKSQTHNYISPKGWVSYFKKLLNCSQPANTESNRTGKNGQLDFLFNLNEIVEQIKKPKNK